MLERDNMLLAYKRVKANKGSHGVDGVTLDELPEFLKQELPNIRQKLMKGKYTPHAVRRAEIPKLDGGVRLLGIPTELDRLIA